MEKSTIRQSALIISVIVPALLLFGWAASGFVKIGTFNFYFNYACQLATVWVYLAIFRNVKFPSWLRIALCVIPVAAASVLLATDPHTRLSFPRWIAPIFSSWFIFRFLVFLPVLGLKPSCGKALKTNIFAFCILMLAFLTIGFLPGYLAKESGYDMSSWNHAVNFLYSLFKSASIWALISLTYREEIGVLFQRKWVKWTCVAFSIAAMLFLYSLRFFGVLCLEIDIYNLLIAPFVWYIIYCIFRFFKKILITLKNNMDWKHFFIDI